MFNRFDHETVVYPGRGDETTLQGREGRTSRARDHPLTPPSAVPLAAVVGG
jgi:hypothetical protein